MKTIRPAVKLDANGKVSSDPKVEAAQWLLNVPASFNNGKKLRLFFKTKAAAEQKRQELLDNRKKPVGEEKLKQLAARGLTIETAIDYAIAHAPLVATLTVGDLLDEYRQHRAEEVGVSHRYLVGLDSYKKRIKEVFGSDKIGDVTTTRLRKFLGGLTGRGGGSASTATRNHYIETLKAVFNYAKEHRYLSTSPADLLKLKKDEEGEEGAISILSVPDAAKLLEALAKPEHAEVAAAALLQLFTAPRRSEVMHITWEVVTDRFLRLDVVKKGTKKRPVEMPPVLLEWLAPLRKKSGYVFDPRGLEIDRTAAKVPPKERKKALYEAQRKLEDAYVWRLNLAAEAAGVALPKNVLRHTAITMRTNFTEDVAATARWAGNSPAIIEAHYLGAATKDDAERFYALKPQQSGTVIAMTPATATQTAAAEGQQQAAG